MSEEQRPPLNNLQAITFPRDNDGQQRQNEENQPGASNQQDRPSSSGFNGRRITHNLQGLLQFATEMTRSEDASGRAPRPPMDEERRRFLAEAIDSLTFSETEQIKLSKKILSDKEIISQITCGTEVPKTVLDAFTCVQETIYNIDSSIGFYKLGGYDIFPVCFSCEHSEVRHRTCQLLAELCQNNPFCQQHALDCGFLPILLNFLRMDDQLKVLKSALYAVSCMVREHEPSARVFFDEGGCEALGICLYKPFLVLQTKAAFLFNCLFDVYPEMKEYDDIFDILKALIYATHNSGNRPDQVLNALYKILTVKDCEFVKYCVRKEPTLKDKMELYMEELEPEDEQEKQHCEEILKLVEMYGLPPEPEIVKGEVER